MAISFVGSIAGGAINGGNVTLTLPSHAASTVSVVTVTLGTTRDTTVLAVASSSGGPYTQIIGPFQDGNIRFGVFRRVLTSSLELQAVVTGSGGSTDATSAACHIFGGVDLVTPEDVTPTVTFGGSTAPDSPSITVASCSCAIITSIGLDLIGAPTAPSSFLNSTSAFGNDTHDATTAQAWITNATTSAFDPAAWTSSASAVWAAATTALRPAVSTSTYWLMVDPLYPPVSLGTREIIPY